MASRNTLAKPTHGHAGSISTLTNHPIWCRMLTYGSVTIRPSKFQPRTGKQHAGVLAI